jgi:hypothetical protein
MGRGPQDPKRATEALAAKLDLSSVWTSKEPMLAWIEAAGARGADEALGDHSMLNEATPRPP